MGDKNTLDSEALREAFRKFDYAFRCFYNFFSLKFANKIMQVSGVKTILFELTAQEVKDVMCQFTILLEKMAHLPPPKQFFANTKNQL